MSIPTPIVKCSFQDRQNMAGCLPAGEGHLYHTLGFSPIGSDQKLSPMALHPMTTRLVSRAVVRRLFIATLLGTRTRGVSQVK